MTSADLQSRTQRRKPPQWVRSGLLLMTLAAAALALWYSMFSKERVADVRGIDTAQSQSIEQAARKLDAVFAASWDEAGITPAEPATTLEICRRISLGLCGTIPSVEEIRALESQPEDRQLQWWIDHVLSDRRTFDHLAERFGRAMVGVDNGPFVVYRRRRFVSWLSDQLESSRPFDAVVRDIVDSNGLWTDSPGVNFYTATISDQSNDQPDPIKLAAKTSRAFLGMRIDCLECHDDFLGTIKVGDGVSPRSGEQTDFHKLAAFFADTGNSLAGIRDSGETTGYRYRLLGDDEETVIDPAVPFFPECLPESGTLRQRLAAWLTAENNLPFARSTINRLWAIAFGKPLVEPVDDIPWGSTVPAELDLLAQDFIDHGYDMRRTLRVILASRVFQIDSQMPNEEITQTHESLWAVFPQLRLRPEQMAASLLQATSLSTLDATDFVLSRVISFGIQNEFVRRFGDFGVEEFTRRGETVTQRLLMFNGDLLRGRIDAGLLAPAKVGAVAPDPGTAIDTIYLACFTRYPTPDERAVFAEQIGSETGWRQTTLRDFYWAMLNSAEFSWNH